MSDRLAELRRQRALVQQHLEWLDREIAAEAAKSPAPQGTAMTSANVPAAIERVSLRESAAASPSTSATPELAPSENPEADRILEQYRTVPGALHRDVRKGCFLYFAAALGIFFAVVAILYFALSYRR